MKTFTISIVVLLLFAVNTYGQWTRNYTLDSQSYQSVSFYDESTGFVSTAFPVSKLLKTTDGGLTWTEVPIPDPLNQIHYVEMQDENTVWVVQNQDPVLSTGGNICKSDDCGLTWEVMFETNDGVRELFILDENHLWAGTDSRRVHRTVDGGETWNVSEILAMPLIHDMYFINQDTGWATGGGTQDYIEKTTDGGITWEVQFQRPNSQGFGKRIEFLNSQKGYCVGFECLMLKTNNAGETWEYVAGEYLGDVGILQGLPYTYDITGIDFINEERGWIVGRAGGCPQPPGHFIMSTKEGGESWQMDMLDEYLPLYGLNAVDFNEKGIGWTIGSNGLLLSRNLQVGVQNAPAGSKLKIFPNPAQNFITINSGKDFGTVKLYNQFGQIVYKAEAVNLKEIKLDLSNYQSGVYFIEVDNAYNKIIKI